MAGYIEDRWLNKRVNPETGKRDRTALYGKGKRYKVAGVPGVRDRSFETLADAKKWQSEAITDTRRGAFYDPRNGDMTLREYVEVHWWPTLRLPITTRATMKPRVFRHILPHLGGHPLNRIGPDEIKWWVTRAEQDIDVNTVRTTWKHFSSIMQAAFKAKRIPENPFRDPDLSPPKAPQSKAKAWTLTRVAAVREATLPRYRILVDLAVGAGLRQGEAFGVSPEDVDGEVLHVVRQVIKINGKLAFGPPKGNKERDTVCPPALAAAIDQHMAEFPPVEVTLPWIDPNRPNLAWDDRPLVAVRLLTTSTRRSGRGGGAINRTTWDEKVWKPALVRAGVIPEPVREMVQGETRVWERVKWSMKREDGFHVLRHTFASVVLHAGETIATLAAWLGHSDPAFTLRTYVHFLPEAGRKAITVLGAWIAQPAAAGGGVDSPESPVQPDSPQILPGADEQHDGTPGLAGQDAEAA